MVTELEKQPILCQVQINLLRYKTQISKGEKIPGQCLLIFILYSYCQWHPTPVLLPGKSHGRRSLVGCSPWGR